MKRVFHVLSVVAAVLLFHFSSNGQSQGINSVTIKCVDFSIETDVDVSCAAFDQTFKDNEKVKFVFNKSDLNQFESLTKEFEEVKSLKSFDVRGSINLIYGKAGDKYCFNKFGYFYKDGKFYYNKKLLIFIEDEIYKNHPQYLDTLRRHE